MKNESTYIDRAYEILVAHENVGHGKTKDDGQHPCADESLDRLFGRQLDELRAAKGNAADIGEDIIGDDQ